MAPIQVINPALVHLPERELYEREMDIELAAEIICRFRCYDRDWIDSRGQQLYRKAQAFYAANI